MVATLAALALLVPAPGAGAALYWTESGAVVSARLDGGGIDPNFYRPLFPGTGWDLAATDTHLYWTNLNGIEALNLDGPAAQVTVVPGTLESGLVGGIGVGSERVFWTRPEQGAIGGAALDGAGRNDTLVSGIVRPCDVAVAGQYVYWVSFQGIGRARLDGSEVDESFVPSLAGCAIATDGAHVYWASQDGIGRASTAGDDVRTDYVPTPNRAEHIAVRHGVVYWADRPNGMVFSSIGRAVPGQPPVPAWIPTAIFGIPGIAVDSRPEASPRPRPSLPIRFGQLRRNVGRGTAVIDVWVPERGDLAVTSPAIGWKVLRGPEPPAYRRGGFRWRLKLWPGKSGIASERVKRQLARRGRAPITLRLSYAETAQLPYLATKKLALRKKLPRRPARLSRRSVGHHR